MIVAVFDANVLAPGFAGTIGASVELIERWQSGAFELVVSEHLLEELERTFGDHYYRSRFTTVQVARALASLRNDATIIEIEPLERGIATHLEDDLVLATALSAGADVLVTRDKQLLKLNVVQGLMIVHPADFLAFLSASDAPKDRN